MNLVTVFRSFNDAEARVVHTTLEAAGLDASVENEAMGSALGVTTGGVRVCVPEEQAQEALALVADIQQQPPPPLP
jgi:hypothetical protein